MTAAKREPDQQPAVVPPRPLAARHYSERQVEILDQLEAIILAEGFRQLTIGELAARVQCSRRTLYALAPTKDELVMLVIDRLYQRIGKHAQQHLQAIADPADRLRAFVREGTNRLREASLSFGEDVAGTAAVGRLVRDHHRYAADLIAGLIRNGIAEGGLRPVHAGLAAYVIGAAMDRVSDPDVLLATGVSEAEAMQEAIELIIQGMLHR